MRSRSPSFWIILVIAVIAFIALGLEAWRLKKPLDDDAAYIPKEEVITPEIELLRAYVRIDTSNPPGLELAGARFLIGELRKRGVEAELIESAPGRANVYARIRGKRPGEALLLLNHIDVVPVDPKAWSLPPFAGRTKMNMLYGRGTLDMKGIGICQLLAFTDLAQSGRRPERDVVFLATSDEEQGGALGVGWLLEHRPDVFEGARYALNEGGITETLREQVTCFEVEIGTKQICKLNLYASDRRSLERARIVLLPLQDPRDPLRVLPAVPSVLREASLHRKQNRELMVDVEKTIADGDFWKLPTAYRALMVDSVTLDAIKPFPGGGFRAGATLHDLPDESPDVAIDRVRKLVEPLGVRVEVEQKQGPSPITPFQTPMFELIRQAVRARYGDIVVGPLILPFSSNDSRYLRPRGILAYGVWPFPVSLYQTWGIHGVDERVRLDWFVDGVNLMRDLVHRYAFAESVSTP